MKKFFKISLVTAMLLITLLLSSCDALDDMRKQQAFWENEEKTVLLYGGERYLKLPGSLQLFMSNYYEHIYVTEKDVPVLLSGGFGDTFWVNETQEIIFDYESTYCHEDIYEAMMDKASNYKIDHYCIENEKSNEYELLNYGISTIVDEILASEPKELSEEELFDDYEMLDWIYSCDEDMMFMGDSIEVGYFKGKIYLICLENWYEVPVEHEDIFSNLWDMNRSLSSKA